MCTKSIEQINEHNEAHGKTKQLKNNSKYWFDLEENWNVIGNWESNKAPEEAQNI